MITIHIGAVYTPQQLKGVGFTKSYPCEGKYVFCQDNRRIIWSPRGEYSGRSEEDNQEGEVVNIIEMKDRHSVPSSA